MKPGERRERISAIVRQASRASVDELAERLNISRETVRRDLALLSEQGRSARCTAVRSISRPRGRARSTSAAGRRCPRRSAIATAAAALFRPGDSLLIDAGSTTTLFAQALGTVGSFSVITNSVAVAAELWNAPHKSDVYLLGGRYLGDGQELLGPLTVEQIRRCRPTMRC